jgi:hypothetical protein
MEPAQKKARATPKEEVAFRAMLEHRRRTGTGYRGNPNGICIAAITERAIATMGLTPDRNEVLAVTANILAYRKAMNNGKGKHKRRFQTEEMSAAVRDCLTQYSNAQLGQYKIDWA